MEASGPISDAGKPARQRFAELRAALALRNAQRVRQAREDLIELSERRHEIQRAATEAARRAESSERVRTTRNTRAEDKLEISDEAREAAELATNATHSNDTERAQRVAQLRAEHESGRLDTPERVQRAAARLLGSQG